MKFKFFRLAIFSAVQAIFIIISVVILLSKRDRIDDTKQWETFARYPARQNMSKCSPTYGTITVFIFYDSAFDSLYEVAQKTLHCYLKSTKYKFLGVNSETDERVNRLCRNEKLLFKKHCAVSLYLEDKDTDWMLVLDADTGVINPNHCIEEWIDPRVDIIFYERFFTWEIASGNYLVKNTKFARNFLRKWAEWEFRLTDFWHGEDNGVLQMHIFQTVIPAAKRELEICDTIWHKAESYETYLAFVTCVKVFLGATRIWPGKIRIMKRAHAWVKDGVLTDHKWIQHDFMYHGWKDPDKIGLKPFQHVPDPKICGMNLNGWRWNKELCMEEAVAQTMIKDDVGEMAIGFPKLAKELPYLSRPDIADCYPHCDDGIWESEID